jgi:hypothetical protein
LTFLDPPIAKDTFDNLGFERIFVVIGRDVERTYYETVSTAETKVFIIDDRTLRGFCICVNGACSGACRLKAVVALDLPV